MVSTYYDALQAWKRTCLLMLDMSLSELYHDNRDGLKVLRKIAPCRRSRPLSPMPP
jgi:hypothetical protein